MFETKKSVPSLPGQWPGGCLSYFGHERVRDPAMASYGQLMEGPAAFFLMVKHHFFIMAIGEI